MRRTKNKERSNNRGVAAQDRLASEGGPPEKPPQAIPNIEGLKHEYTEVNNTIRQYSTLRFAIFTVYFAALSGLAAVAFGFFESKSGNPEQVKLWGRIGGLLVSVLFFRYELRVQALINLSLARGKWLELQLGYKQLLSRPSGGYFSMPRFTQYFYCLLILFWLVMIIRMLVTLSA
jgi:hypothetical protein